MGGPPLSQSSLNINPSQPSAPLQNRPLRGGISRRLFVLGEVLLLLALSAYMMGGAKFVPFHADESTILYTTRDLYDIMHNRTDRLLYSPTPDQVSPSGAHDQELRLLNGTVARYVYGYFSMNRKTLEPFEPINEDWDWGGDWAYNLEMGHKPADTPLNRARLVSSLFLVGALFALYGLARRIGGPGVAVIAALYFALNPAILINGRRAFQESFWLFFGLWSLYIAVGLCQRIRGLRRNVFQKGPFLPVPLASYLFLGGTLGLTIASKHTGVFYVVAAVGAVTLAPLWARRPVWLKHILGLALMAVVMIGIFWILTPAWWGNPATSLNEMLRLRSELLSGQIRWFVGYSNTVERLAGFMRQAFFVQPQYYEVVVWKDYIPDQIAAYEASGWQGIAPGGLIAGFLVVGLIACVRSLVKREPLVADVTETDTDSPVPLAPLWPDKMGAWVALWLLMAGLAAAVSTPLEWQRYYLPLYPAFALFLGVGVMELVRVLMKPLRERAAKQDEVVSL